MTIFDLSSKIRQLNKEEKYQEALQLFKEQKETFTKEQIRDNIYLVTAMLSALRHAGHLEAALKFLEIYSIPITIETDTYLLGTYGWIVYSLLKKEIAGADMLEHSAEEPEEELFIGNTTTEQTYISKRGIEFLQLVSSRQEVFLRTVESYVFQSLLKYEQSRNNVNWQIVLDICNFFTPEKLSQTCAKIKVSQKGKMVEKELASDRENWYAAKSKAYLELGQFEECRNICEEALDRFERLHYNNQSWFARRIALASKGMGHTEDAINGLKRILLRKKDWFIYMEIAELQFEQGDYESALENCRKGMAGHGDMEFKVKLLFLTATILKKLNQTVLAQKHHQLNKLLRESVGWKIPFDLQEELKSVPESISGITNSRILIKELSEFWEPSEHNPTGRLNGTIERILHDNEQGVVGFIKQGKDSFYFSIRRSDPVSSTIKLGKSVQFEVEQSKSGKPVATKLKVERN